MKRTLLLVIVLALAMSASLWAVALTEGFEGATVPPMGWTMSYADPNPPAGNVMIHTTDEHHSGLQSFRFSSLSTASNEQYDQYLVTPLLNTVATNTNFSFWYKGNASGAEVFKVGWSSTDNNINSFTWSNEIAVPTNTPWTQYVKNDVPVGTHYMAIHYYSDYMWYVYVDDVVGPDIFATDVDMAALTLAGNTTPSVGAASNYTVHVKNNGNLAANAYTVKLFTGTAVEVASATITTPLASGAETDIVVPWTPTTVGPVSLYAKAIITGDGNALNDETNHMNVNVQPAGIVAVSIGTGTATLGTIPLDFYYKSSLSQSIYYPSELQNAAGQITGLTWHNNFVTATLTATPIKIWLGTTTNADLNTAFIPSTDLTLVFDGNVALPAGANDITVTFTTPFNYTGGNLVVAAMRPLDAVYYSSNDKFVTTNDAAHAGRTREYHNDTIAPVPETPTGGTAIADYPNVTLYLLGGGGTISGTVTSGATPLDGATVSVQNGATVTTSATGTYTIQHVPAGAHNVTASKTGYTPSTQSVTVVEEQTSTQNFNLAPLPTTTVTGHVVANTDLTTGISGATVTLTGTTNYNATTNATGDFTISNVLAGTYNYTVTATGFSPATGTQVVGSTPVNMGNLVVTETMYPASQVAATLANDDVNLTWAAPNPNAVNITEGFEGATFPPENWTQVINNTGAAGTTGLFPTWCQIGTITFSTSTITPHGGVKQAALYWDYAHQDEWLVTPQFVCPAGGSLNFWTSCHYGSTYADHYYVKVSTDNGTTWTSLWDASSLPASDNTYTTAVNVPLTTYAGQNIKLAWQAVDGDNQGIWYTWAIDDIQIGTPTDMLRFNGSDLEHLSFSKPSTRNLTAGSGSFGKDGYNPVVAVPQNIHERPVIGYKVWRLQAGTETNEAQWTLLTNTAITNLNYTDTTWPPAAAGDYKWAVKAIYTGDVAAPAAFSNVIPFTISGTIAGTVTSAAVGHAPIAGATVTAGTVSATTSANGTYTMTVPVGTYTVSVTANGFMPMTQNNVVVTANQTNTQDFQMAVSQYLISESFENATFPPTGWTQTITNHGAATTGGLFPTWCRIAEQTFTSGNVTPPDGTYQAGLYWSESHQDEWLITPPVTLDADHTAGLQFWTYVHNGSTYADHYYVKISSDDGATWTPLWDASALPEGDNNYTDEITVNAPASYAGHTVKFAFQAVDGDNAGIWYTWFIDNVRISAIVANDNHVTPASMTALKGNYPNPFNPSTIISYSVKQTAPVTLKIYNVKGQEVKTLVNGVVNAGNHEVTWNGKDNNNNNAASGVYFYKMTAGKYTSTKKMIMMK